MRRLLKVRCLSKIKPRLRADWVDRDIESPKTYAWCTTSKLYKRDGWLLLTGYIIRNSCANELETDVLVINSLLKTEDTDTQKAVSLRMIRYDRRIDRRRRWARVTTLPGNQSLRPMSTRPTSCGADNQLASPKINWSYAMTMRIRT